MYIPDVVPDDDRETMVDRAGYGGSIELGESVAVLVVDMTCEFVKDRYPNGHSKTAEPALNSINRLLECARESGIRAYFSRALPGRHPVERGRWGDSITAEHDQSEVKQMTQLADSLSPTDDDVVFEKHKPSMFFGTQLESMLTYQGVDTVIVTGMTTSGCVRATVIDAFSYNYRIAIPKECVADRSQISHEINLFDMDMKYGDVCELNTLLDRIEI